ncbi:glycosyltransferase family 58 protein [Cokeromyces recurvatus]|uniref:glycosyltransferase family 58 protein n=1 Tax=Cokeromyces recurvatus TaxID=90255 RepID=UPI00221E5AF0|nr:glycosyltransferase family 58 protein [Cokeromyces recurvatus]KAI7901078.1 glycosyltransferase family 58 protein [Cokeromyces recurvatus]
MIRINQQKKKKKQLKTREINKDERKTYKLEDIIRIPLGLLCNQKYFWHLTTIFLLGEFVLSTLIIHQVRYTEIDWKAYMQEVEGFLNGERNYINLKGDTGPLVYPAGFVYVYSLLYYVTNKGQKIRLAQYIFEGIYLASQFVVCAIYRQSKKVPPYVILLLGCSKRFHSIFLLRCFNDPVAMLFMFGCILAMTYRRWTLSTLLFSIALSIKMNVLLFFPAFGIILWQALGAYKTMGQLGLIVLIQGMLAYPFIAEYPVSYFSKAFEFSRIFDYQWTVNWRMMSEETFVSEWFSKQLLYGHALTLLMFIIFIWCEPKGGLIYVFKQGFSGHYRNLVSLSNDEIISMMFTSNFIGIIFSRSLHYQFYSWYFQTLPYLLWQSSWQTTGRLTSTARILIFVTIEGCWLTFPSTVKSSWTLIACHLLILFGVYGNAPGADYKMPSLLVQ